ncbi:MAG: hypothetical protein AABY22_01510 [Nanoarchaeota archaeon]
MINQRGEIDWIKFIFLMLSIILIILIILFIYKSYKEEKEIGKKECEERGFTYFDTLYTLIYCDNPADDKQVQLKKINGEWERIT